MAYRGQDRGIQYKVNGSFRQKNAPIKRIVRESTVTFHVSCVVHHQYFTCRSRVTCRWVLSHPDEGTKKMRTVNVYDFSLVHCTDCIKEKFFSKMLKFKESFQ